MKSFLSWSLVIGVVAVLTAVVVDAGSGAAHASDQVELDDQAAVLIAADCEAEAESIDSAGAADAQGDETNLLCTDEWCDGRCERLGCFAGVCYRGACHCFLC